MLTAHLPRLVDELCQRDGLVAWWWVRRHRDLIRPESDQHLAVFLRLTSPDHYGPVAEKLGMFAVELEERGLPCQLTLASYPQHPARYGEGAALVAAEQVFSADTKAAIAQLITAETAQVRSSQALAAASMAHLAGAFAPDRLTGYRALVRCLPQSHGSQDRQLRDTALGLADPGDCYLAARSLPGGDALAAAWSARDAALTVYRAALLRQRSDPIAVLPSLLHEHHVRAVGVDPEFERQTGRLARAAALRRLALAGAL
jgi:thiopeptide-type bacteriocin biosynthesis protein